MDESQLAIVNRGSIKDDIWIDQDIKQRSSQSSLVEESASSSYTAASAPKFLALSSFDDDGDPSTKLLSPFTPESCKQSGCVAFLKTEQSQNRPKSTIIDNLRNRPVNRRDFAPAAAAPGDKTTCPSTVACLSFRGVSASNCPAYRCYSGGPTMNQVVNVSYRYTNTTHEQ